MISRVIVVGNDPLYRSGVRMVLRKISSRISIEEFDLHQAFKDLCSLDLIILCLRGSRHDEAALSSMVKIFASRNSSVVLFSSIQGKKHHMWMKFGLIDAVLPMSIGVEEAYGFLLAYIDGHDRRNKRKLIGTFPQNLFLPDLDDISKIERRVLLLLTDGMSNSAISDELNISAKTVKAHLSNVYKKLNFRNRTHAAVCASEIRYV